MSDRFVQRLIKDAKFTMRPKYIIGFSIYNTEYIQRQRHGAIRGRTDLRQYHTKQGDSPKMAYQKYLESSKKNDNPV